VRKRRSDDLMEAWHRNHPTEHEEVLLVSNSPDAQNRNEEGTNEASQDGHYDVPNLFKVASGFQRSELTLRHSTGKER
jgi:hypothetical protein